MCRMRNIFVHGWIFWLQSNQYPPTGPIKDCIYMSMGTFAYRKLPFYLKNVGATFQREMNYAFHDIKHIVQPYLDDLHAHL